MCKQEHFWNILYNKMRKNSPFLEILKKRAKIQNLEKLETRGSKTRKTQKLGVADAERRQAVQWTVTTLQYWWGAVGFMPKTP